MAASLGGAASLDGLAWLAKLLDATLAGTAQCTATAGVVLFVDDLAPALTLPGAWRARSLRAVWRERSLPGMWQERTSQGIWRRAP